MSEQNKNIKNKNTNKKNKSTNENRRKEGVRSGHHSDGQRGRGAGAWSHRVGDRGF